MAKLNINKQVWIKRISTNDQLKKQLAKMISWLKIDKLLAQDSRVVIKPNMTYPFYKPGITTSPALIEGLVRVLRGITPHITLVESDGGSYAWPVELAFSGHGIPQLCKKYELTALNLTQEPSIWAETEVEGKGFKVELPQLLVRETDYFITMPVPKVHVMTKVSLGFKNQWGCLPDVKRVRHHPQFAHKVLAINKLLNPKLAVFDGKYLLNRSGPMDGDPIKMELIIAGEVGSATLVCCEIMGINPQRVRHLRLAQQIGMMPQFIDNISLNVENLDIFKKEKFYLQRTFMNWLALAAFKNNFLTKLLYDSKLAKPIHELLYVARGRPKDVSPKW